MIELKTSITSETYEALKKISKEKGLTMQDTIQYILAEKTKTIYMDFITGKMRIIKF